MPSSYPLRRLSWLTLALFLSYLAVAMSLPVISLFVEARLGLGNAAGGLAVGIAFLSTILTRGLAGRRADALGGGRVMREGLWIYAAASLVCLASGWGGLGRGPAFGVLLAGRLVLGVGESLTLVGMITWGIGLAGQAQAGRFLALMGAGMYGSFVLGGPLGLAAYQAGGFGATMAGCALAPLVGLAMVALVPAVAPAARPRETRFLAVLGRVWRHGSIVGLQGVGFAAIGAFQALLFAARGWPHAGAGLACFGVGFVLLRVAGPRLLERWGSRRLVFASLAVEAAGQLLLWTAPAPLPAILGSLLTGAGCSMIYPAMGAEVVGLVPVALRGTAMGAFSAFQDVAYGATGPLAGLAADRFGQPVVFLIGAAAAGLGIGLLGALPRGRGAGGPE